MEHVGWRVQVFWEGEATWFDGVISEYSPDDGFFIKYDDGEEQWEDASGETPIRFLSKPEGDSDDDDAPAPLALAADGPREGGKWSEQPPPSSTYTDADFADDDYENTDNDQEEKAVALKKSSTPEEKSSPVAKSQPKSSLMSPTTSNNPPAKQQPRKATLYVNNTLFFRDEESVREMRKALQIEKKTLVHEHETLARQLVEKEQLAVNLKRELSDLKTRVTLASVLGLAPSSTAGGQSSVPKTASDWSERVLNQKLLNKQTKQEIVELKACVQQMQHANQQQQRQVDQLEEKLARVPRRDLCSLVDLQVEIAQLLEEKRALEATQKPKSASTVRFKYDPSTKSTSEPGTFGWQNDADAHKIALEKELSKLELASSRAKDEIHRWKLNFERENARILPLKARLITLQQELSKFETSNVLLRSAFLRLNPDAEGKISLQTAAEALLALAPVGVSSFTSPDAVITALKQQNVHASGSQEHLVFSDFVACFNRLFKS